MSPDREHSAAPEQIEHGFDEGLGKRPRPTSQRRVGRYGDRADTRTEDELERGRFSAGAEASPDARANRTERRFSQGAERRTD